MIWPILCKRSRSLVIGLGKFKKLSHAPFHHMSADMLSFLFYIHMRHVMSVILIILSAEYHLSPCANNIYFQAKIFKFTEGPTEAKYFD